MTRKSTKTQDDKSISNINQAIFEIPKKNIYKLRPQVRMWVGEVRASSTFLRENVETEKDIKKNEGKGQD